VSSLFSARAFVWGDVDPHGGGLGLVVKIQILKYKDGPERVDSNDGNPLKTGAGAVS
jgi:hypothetical protein